MARSDMSFTVLNPFLERSNRKSPLLADVSIASFILNLVDAAMLTGKGG
jgi:hypothetical protein